MMRKKNGMCWVQINFVSLRRDPFPSRGSRHGPSTRQGKPGTDTLTALGPLRYRWVCKLTSFLLTTPVSTGVWPIRDRGLFAAQDHAVGTVEDLFMRFGLVILAHVRFPDTYQVCFYTFPPSSASSSTPSAAFVRSLVTWRLVLLAERMLTASVRVARGTRGGGVPPEPP